MLPDELQELATEVSNWGRWGDDDERGTQNLIDADATRRGLATVVDGRQLSLAIPLDQTAPQEGGAPGRINPLRTMIAVNTSYTGLEGDAAFNDDMVVMAMAAGTHIDALAHVTYGGFLYNGFPDSVITAEGGATRCGADKIDPILTRGVLLDVAAARGVDRLEPGYAVTADDLDAAVELAKVTIEPGDVALVRTGHVQHLKGGKPKVYNKESPGLGARTVRWTRARDLGAVFLDTYVYDVWPPEDWKAMMVVHMLHIRDMGQLQGQNFDLEALAADCAADGRYEFLFSANPEPFTGACSAPVNPVVTK
jgi:kynurenine formamidase